MKTVVVLLCALSAHAFAPRSACQTAPARRMGTIRFESFWLNKVAEDPNENTDPRILGEVNYKKEFVESYKPDSLLLKKGAKGMFAASSRSADRPDMDGADDKKTARFGFKRERPEKTQRSQAVESMVETDFANINVLGIPTPLTVDASSVNPAQLSFILSVFVGSAVLVVVVIGFPFFFESAASSSRVTPM